MSKVPNSPHLLPAPLPDPFILSPSLPPYLFCCLWVQVGVQQGDGELYLPGAPSFHGGTDSQRGEREEGEQQMNKKGESVKRG